MATVTLTLSDAWITDVATSVSLNVPFRDRLATSAVEGAVRFYAGGRARVITTANNVRTYPLTLEWFNDTDLATLDSWRGRLLLLRDGAGRRVFGTFLAMSVDDLWPASGVLHGVTLTFQAITYSEAV